MKKSITVGLLLIALLVSGCVGGSPKGTMWSAKVNNYRITNGIPSGVSGDYKPDPGYEWLVFSVSVSNLTQESQSLDFIFVGNGFDFIAANGNKYGMGLTLLDPPGSLSEYYKAQQTQTGDIYFEVPIGTQAEKGTLIFKSLENKKDTTFGLGDVPVK